MKKLLLIAALLPVVSAAQIPSGTVSGQILTREGQPASGVRVSAMAVPDAGVPANNATALVSIAMTDSEGRYRLERVLPGRYYITSGLVDFPTYYPGVTTLSGATAVNVLSETPLTGINFTMVLPQGVKVSGRVTSPTGTPLQSASVALFNPTTGMRNVAVGQDGTFEFQRVPPGSYQLTSSSGRPQQPLSIQVIEKDIAGLQLVIIPTVTVSGTVVVDGDSPSPRFSLMFSPFKGGSSIQASGNFSLPVPEGDYRVSWSNVPPGFEVKSITAGSVDLLTSPLKVSVSLPAPQIRTALHVEGNPWVKLAGKVTGVTSSRTLTLTGANVDQVQLPVKADGTFAIDRILPGQYSIRVTPNASTPALFTQPIQVVVPNQDTIDFVIAMPVLKEVPGIVTNAAGAGIQGRISLSFTETRPNGSSGGSMSIALLPDGKFTILMPEGDRHISINVPGYNTRSLTYGATDLMRENMRVTSADAAELRVVLDTTSTVITGGATTGGVAGGGFGGVLGGILTTSAVAAPPPPPPVSALPPPSPLTRIGPDIARANLASSVPPVYPAQASAARVQGTVVLQIQIAADGRVQDIAILSGHPLLHDAAIQAVRQWTYKPFVLAGQTIPVITTVNVDFAAP